MANEITKVTDQNGVDHPFKDAVAQAGVIANTQLIADTVGWSGKNIFDFEGWLTSNNNPFTKNADGSYQFWTNNSIYEHAFVFSETDIDIILSSEISYPSSSPAVSVGFDLLNSNDEVVETLTSNATARACKIRLNRTTAGNVIVKNPMLRKADILDSTYEPYRGTTAFPRDEQAVLGAKNLLPVPYSMASGSENGVTWSTNSDGTVTVSTPNGASTGQANIHLLRPANFPSELLNVPLKLSGCPSGGSNTTYQIGAYHYDGTNSVNHYGDGTESFTFTSDGEKQLSITVRPSVTISTPITFKPMLTLASDTESDYAHYAPYAMTNRELTEKVQGIIDAATNAADFAAFKAAIAAL